ncbi:MAG: diguanylate cyclase [Sulfuritalea sp.]|nr:diguanylate cyclase [Sulfuritalea sp.]
MKQAGFCFLSPFWERLPLITRVMLTAGLAMVVAGSLLLFVSTGKEADFAHAQIKEHLEDEMEALLPAISEWAVLGDYANIEQVLRMKATHADIQSVVWTNARGKTLEAGDQDVALRAPGWFLRWIHVSPLQTSRALLIGGRDYGQVTIRMTAVPAQNRLWESFLDHLGILVLALGIDFVGVLFVLRNGLRPLVALTESANQVARGDYVGRVPPQGSPELLSVIAAFNRMADGVAAAQGALHAEAERLAVTLSSIGDAVIATDTEGRVEFMNPVAAALTGWGGAEAEGLSIPEVFVIISETTREKEDCPVGRVVREGAVVGLADHILLVSRDGVERPIAGSSAPIRRADGHITGTVLTFRDQTEERRTRARLTMAASVFENSLNGVVITDAMQRIVEVNAAFTRITGYSRAEALGQTPRLVVSGRQDASFYVAMWSEIRAAGQWHGEVWDRNKDGEAFPVELAIASVKGEDGSVIHYIGVLSDIPQLKAQEARLRQMAHYDSLTGLPNRALLADRMKVALAQAERSGEKLAVCYLDLDGFKPVNDTCGHATGDRLLEEVARRLRDTVRGGDTVARLGGDEFVLLLANTTDMEQCEISLSRILQSVARPCLIDGAELNVTASIGVTLFPDDKADADILLRHADQALYVAKEAGRNRYCLFNPGHHAGAPEGAESDAKDTPGDT